MKEKLTIVTGNPLKFQQLAHSLGEYFDCEQGVFDTYEIQGIEEEIVMDKLARAYDYFKTPVLVDDTSLHLDELNGFPGSYIRDFLRYLPSYDMGKKFKGTRFKLVSRLGLMKDKDTVIMGIGSIEGMVVDPKVKEPGIRVFDNFIQPDGFDRPLIEFTPEETMEFSHRGNAVRDLIIKLNTVI
jgi:inosine/xanthosine triphosphate pyrophosphatase family protein